MNYLTNLKPLDISVRGFVRLFPWKDWLLLWFEDAVAQFFDVAACAFHVLQHRLKGDRFTAASSDGDFQWRSGISKKVTGEKRANASFVFVFLEAASRPWSVWVPGGSGEVMMRNSPWGIPSGFARRDAGRLGGRRTSPATLSLLFGNLLDFVSAERKKKEEKDVKLW